MIAQSSIKFLKDLQANNNKEWFEEHRTTYEGAKENFLIFITEILEKFSKKDTTIVALKAKECIYRINRDVRFSLNKTPYKHHMGAYICSGGKQSIYAGYYFHLEPSNSVVGGGLWSPEAVVLKKVRQEIDYNFEAFNKIIKSKKFKNSFGDLLKNKETSLSREPKGYEKNNPAIEYIKLKSWIASHPLQDKDLTEKDLANKIVTTFETLQPLVKFLNDAIAE